MARRKIDWSKFSQKQIAVARILTDPERSLTNKEACAEAGISERAFYNWQRDPEFNQLIDDMNEIIMDGFAVEVYKALRRKVLKGDTRAIELAMKRMGVLIDKREVTSDVKVEVTALAAKTNAELLAEIVEKERQVLQAVETLPDVFDVDLSGFESDEPIESGDDAP